MRMPYVVGQWVRGNRFYGRSSLLTRLATSVYPVIRLLGGRRIGKTSLLRQLEHLASPEHSRLVPVFWDLQGVETGDDLLWTLAEALEDSDSIDRILGRTPAAPNHPGDIADWFSRMGRELTDGGRELLLLCDEAEALIALSSAVPTIVEALLQPDRHHARFRVVLTGSLRLLGLTTRSAPQHDRNEREQTAVEYVGALDPHAARELVKQSLLPAEERPVWQLDNVERVRQACGDHPYLLQLVAKRSAETGDVERAIEAVASDEMIEHFLNVDMDLLEAPDLDLLRGIAKGNPPASLDTDSSRYRRLTALGYLVGDGQGTSQIANRFLADWLAR